MAIKCKEICKAMEEIAPGGLAMDFDNVGLLVGDENADVTKVLFALEVSNDVIDEAIDLGANMIIAHHPIMLNPIKQLTAGYGDGAVAYRLARNGINFFAAHTNLDIAKGGVNDVLSRIIGLEHIEGLEPYYEKDYKKIVVFVPESHAKEVQNAMFKAGAGKIGNYSDCSFSVIGEGTFKVPNDGQPFIGKQGSFERTTEARIETIVPGYLLNKVLTEMIKVHPYEEVAYDVFAAGYCPGNESMGRVGILKEPTSLDEFAVMVSDALKIDGCQVKGEKTKEIIKVAVCSGSGGSVLGWAKSRGVDVLVTGEMKHHEILAADEMGIGVIIAGHFATERVVLPELIERLQSTIDAVQYSVAFALSEKCHQPRMILRG